MIVVIGVLAAITVVSYTGLSSRAIAASLQGDLSTSVQQLKMYYTDNGTYPQSLTNDGEYCPQSPSDSRYCLKPSQGNSLSYTSVSPHTSFTLTAARNGITYGITDNTSPIACSGSTSATGGSITTSGNIRTHTFTSGGTFTLTSSSSCWSASVAVDIKGAGGGGGASYDECGQAGSLSSIRLGTDAPYVAYGGGGGSDGYGDCYSSNSPGETIPIALTGITGGAANGGSGEQYDVWGEDGGPGGRVYGALNLEVGQSFTVVVGAGGSPGHYPGSNVPGEPGGNGIVTFSYAL